MESAEARVEREANARGKISLALFAGFVGLIFGLLAPVYAFGQRLAVQEERMRVVAEGVREINSKLDQATNEMANLRESLARKGIQTSRGN